MTAEFQKGLCGQAETRQKFQGHLHRSLCEPIGGLLQAQGRIRVEQNPRAELAVEGIYWAMGTVGVKGKTRSADG